MADHLHLYMNNPTAGGVDGTEISGGDETLPLTFTLDSSVTETGVAKCAIRCDEGYEISGDTEIWLEGSNTGKWALAADNSYTDTATALASANWGSSITLAGVAAVNTIFWAKATSTVSENPNNDKTVDIVARGMVAAVG